MPVQRNRRTNVTLPTVSVGTPDESLTTDDLEELMDSVKDSPYLTFIVTGYYTEIYPGKEDEDQITLSYVIDTDTFLDSLRNNDDGIAATVLNDSLTNTNYGKWDDVNILYIVVNDDLETPRGA